MKTIINAKNALITLFALECFSSLIYFLFSFISVNFYVSNLTYLLYRLMYIIGCIGLLYLPNEYISKTTQKIGLWTMIIHKGINIILYNILTLINPENTLYILFKNNFGESANVYFGLYSSIISLIVTTAFLMFIWGFQIKKSYKWWITLLFFLPGLISMTISFIGDYSPFLYEYQYQISEIITIIVYIIMAWLILKAYTTRNII